MFPPQAHEWGGKFVEGPKSTEPFYSKSDTVYVLGERDGQRSLEQIATEGGIGIAFYRADGKSQFIYSRRHLTLVEVKAVDGSVDPAGLQTFTDLTYEMDKTYKWNVDRDLEVQENVLGATKVYHDDQESLQSHLLTTLDNLVANFGLHDHSPETVEKLHKYGIEATKPILSSMTYKSLRTLFEKLKKDNSKEGIIKKNQTFGE